ncbi:hypothetical protein ACF09H_29920 [Streptomyces sp. NPDC014983]|uniref:hypothetical protein n=1 Tax=Streptomyces sp. NPDC014983 TaxID=3364933 RepID=UPI0036F7FB8E
MGSTLGPPQHALRGADRERRLAVEDWLLKAARNRQTAAAEWGHQGVALLTAGRVWDVVRAPYTVLTPTFDRNAAPGELRRRVLELRVPGAVFCAYYRPHLYVLVPPGADRHWPHRDCPPGVECLGAAQTYMHYIGVPRLDRTEPPGPFWLIPPDHRRRLADPEQLYAALRACTERPDQMPGAP